jgi:hypothetical protein
MGGVSWWWAAGRSSRGRRVGWKQVGESLPALAACITQVANGYMPSVCSFWQGEPVVRVDLRRGSVASPLGCIDAAHGRPYDGLFESGSPNSPGVVVPSCRTSRTACDATPSQGRFAEFCEPLFVPIQEPPLCPPFHVMRDA